MLIFYYFKEVIHSPVRQSNGELEAANGQFLRRASCCVSELPSAHSHGCLHESLVCDMELAVTCGQMTQYPTGGERVPCEQQRPCQAEHTR